MPRKPRKKSETGIYHAIVRGIGQQDIFHEEDAEIPGNHKKDIARKRGMRTWILLDDQPRSFIAKRRLWRYISVYETLGYKLRILVQLEMRKNGTRVPRSI